MPCLEIINKKEVKEKFNKEVTSSVQNTQIEEVEDTMKHGTNYKKGINEAAGKMIGKEERPQRKSWFVKECQIMLEDKKRVYNKMVNRNTRQNEQEYTDKRKEACEIFRHKQ